MGASMTNPRARISIAGAILCLAALGASGCESDAPSEEVADTASQEASDTTSAEVADAASEEVSAAHHQASAPSAKSKAADLRSALDMLLTEHVNVAAAATGAALGGREAEFQAAAVALDQNSVAVSNAVGSVYGPEVEQTFLPLWREHIDLVVDYTIGVGTGDKAKQDEAVSALMEYSADLTNFLSTANPDLPRPAFTELLKTHGASLKAVIDAQAAKDPAATFQALHVAHDQMSAVALALAESIVQQFPQNYQ
jgi:hypothetical protein